MTATAPALAEAVEARERVLSSFLDDHQDRLARACEDLARAFARGGVLIPFGAGPAAADAAQVALDLVQPPQAGRRGLPALAPAPERDACRQVELLARPGDVALSIAHAHGDEGAAEFLAAARRQDMLTIALEAGPGTAGADHVLAVAGDDPRLVQEVQSTARHLLCDLVHAFFEHPGLLDEACITCGDVAVEAIVVEVQPPRAIVELDGLRQEIAVELIADPRPGDRLLCHAGVALERTGRGDAPPAGAPGGLLRSPAAGVAPDALSVLAGLRTSIVRAGREASAIRRAIDLAGVAKAARAVREALEAGGRLLALGDDASGLQAHDLAADAMRQGRPALALVDGSGTEHVAAHRLATLARPRDVVVAISSGGPSPAVADALQEAQLRRLVTVAVDGRSEEAVADLPAVDHLLVARGDGAFRRREALGTIHHLLLDVVGSAS